MSEFTRSFISQRQCAVSSSLLGSLDAENPDAGIRDRISSTVPSSLTPQMSSFLALSTRFGALALTRSRLGTRVDSCGTVRRIFWRRLFWMEVGRVLFVMLVCYCACFHARCVSVSIVGSSLRSSSVPCACVSGSITTSFVFWCSSAGPSGFLILVLVGLLAVLE